MEGAPKPYAKHISESSQEYEEFKEAKNEFAPSYDNCFGESAISNIDFHRKIIKDTQQIIDDVEDEDLTKRKQALIEEMNQFIQADIEKLKKSLQKDFDTEAKLHGFLSFFHEVGESPQIINKVKERLIRLGEEIPYESIHALFLKGYILDSEFEEMIRHHIDLHNKRREEFNERLPDMLADFRDVVLEAIKDGDIPISQDLLESRMAETKVYLADNMEMMDDVCGTYSASEGIIKVTSNEDHETQKKHIYHEMVHALSGKTLLTHNKTYNNKTTVDHQRLGLRFMEVDKEGEYRGKKFRWLNEAVTEEIAMRLSKTEEGSYKRERETLDSLYTKGLSRDAIYEAYFENYDPESKEKVPAWKNFVEKMSELYPGINGARMLRILEEKDKMEIELLEKQQIEGEMEEGIPVEE